MLKMKKIERNFKKRENKDKRIFRNNNENENFKTGDFKFYQRDNNYVRKRNYNYKDFGNSRATV